jgi:hypothetical protein
LVVCLLAGGCDRGAPASAPAGAVGAGAAAGQEAATGAQSTPAGDAAAGAADAAPAVLSPELLVRSRCAACHSLEVVHAQRLDRDGWSWVLDDMEEFGFVATPDERERIVEYLAREHGPEANR